MFELRVEHSFSAGHALRQYVGPCANPHGHNYRVQVAVEGRRLGPIGLLMDFGALKRAVRAVCEPLDHVYLNDLAAFAEVNPSAENVARYIYEQVSIVLAEAIGAADVRLKEVVVQETDTAWAIYRPER
jgi:6-pyruvoyltetrahydropterin/6-carboxytetrahydropterin synthase